MNVSSLKILRQLSIPLLSLWLGAWLILSWPAIQDDALIHLRYADFLYSRHTITFDGVHASFGASSLLYVSLLACLRAFTVSATLSRAVSSVAHILLFATLAVFYWKSWRTASLRVQLFALSILCLLVAPSSVRWLDDGMETGIVLCIITLLVFHTHRLSLKLRVSTADFFLSCALGFTLVFLRIELATAAIFASTILVAAAWQISSSKSLRSIPLHMHFVAGAVAAAVAIRLLMHSFLPDTALAKSHGFSGFGDSIHAAETVLTGALLFGIGSLCLWLVSAIIVLRSRHARRLPTLVANLIFPFVLLAAAARGQEIQGARYLVWCFFFSICWNLLELRRAESEAEAKDGANSMAAFPVALTIFLLCCVAVLPFESHLMARVLTTRANTMNVFLHQDLATPLAGQKGIAGDVGYISYFSNGSICDLAGLVNGRAAAALTAAQRVEACAATHPAFVFANASQASDLATYLDMKDWKVCGQYDFGNLRSPDRHFLIVQPALIHAVCTQTNYQAQPVSLALTESVY